MGRRRGRTGPGGAVVSSLSDNAGKTVRPKKDKPNKQPWNNALAAEDDELIALAGLSFQTKDKPKRTQPAASSSSDAAASTSVAASSSSWLGKTPQQMLQEWCAKNNRKKPKYCAPDTDGLVKCLLHAGRKDGKPTKGDAFKAIVRVGEKPGDEYAALAVLHHVEKGKPLERLLAPELRQTWLDLDKHAEERDVEMARRAQIRERRQAFAKKKERADLNKLSATINISSSSRQMIEDALLQQKVLPNADGASKDEPADSESQVTSVPSAHVVQELVRLGFSRLDATDTATLFATVAEAVDYLCLNLDESELPKSFAPPSDVEVVQFTSKTDAASRRVVDADAAQTLMRLTALSKLSADRALRKAGGDFNVACQLMYAALTHDLLKGHIYNGLGADHAAQAEEERALEAETISAIYDEDARSGVGVMKEFPGCWATEVSLGEGLPAIGCSEAVKFSFVDIDGNYPLSAPLVFLTGETQPSSSRGTARLGAPHRRLLLKAVAAELSTVRESAGVSTAEPLPVPAVHAVLSFVADANEKQLLAAASKRVLSGDVTTAGTGVAPQAVEPDATNKVGTSEKRPSRPIENPVRAKEPRNSPGLQNMRERRAQLPAFQARAEIISFVNQKQVTVVSGATGSGKTTQVPQYLLEDATATGRPVSIVCTQPRRIAAISVAERVAKERCEQAGESVGYQVKLNTKRSRNTRLLFCTTGILLRRLQGDPELKSLTHVVVDEVHERSVETDFLLLLLREILPSRPGLRVVLMSATLDAEKFSGYFVKQSGLQDEVPIITIEGRTFPVEHHFLADAVALSGYSLRPGDRYARKKGRAEHAGKHAEKEMRVTSNQQATSMKRGVMLNDVEEDGMSFNVSVHPSLSSWDSDDSSDSAASNRQTTALIDEEQVNVDLIDMLVRKIDEDSRRTEAAGAILIFLPGVAEIAAVIRKLSSGTGNQFIWPLPLHSLLSPDEQSKVFKRAPEGKRKVICATNIAETSITVEDVTVVIDSLRVKEMGYDPLNGCSILEEAFISKAAAKQRAGRAGRVSKGTCYRLVREHTFVKKLAAQQKPEIQRVALEHLVLNILSILPEDQVRGDPQSFLNKAVDPPPEEAVARAVKNLVDIGALEQTSLDDSSASRCSSVKLTALGWHLTGIPVDPRIGKLLIYGAVFSCLDAMLTVAATLSERSPFFSPFEQREEAREAREPFVWGKSDLLTFVKAFDSWRKLRESRSGYAEENSFLTRNFLSRKTLSAIEDARRPLADAIADAGFATAANMSGRSRYGWERAPEFNEFNSNLRVLRAVLCAGLYPNLARIDLPETTYQEMAGGAVPTAYKSKDLKLRSSTGERVFLHPESVNFHQGNYENRWLAYFTKVKTSRVFVRDSTMVSPYAILLFGGDIQVLHERGLMSVDKWVMFRAPARVAVLAKELRKQLDSLLMRKFSDTALDLARDGQAVQKAIIHLLTSEM